MVKRKVHFTLDCAKPGSQFTVEGLHVGDKRSCEFHILLRNGIVPLSFDDENIAVIMNAQKPDGTTISTLCDISEDKKEVVYTLDVQDTTVAGIVNYELIIAAYDGENYCVLYSATFSTVVSTGVIVPVFKKLDSEPDDWATGYKKYFRHTQNGYEKITDETCPTFNSNDFYFLVNPNYDSENDYSAFEQTVANVQSLLLRVGAVEAKNAEQDTTIEGKAGKVGGGSSTEIITATGSGDIQRSGKSFANSIGEGSTLTVPTTKAVKDALDPKANSSDVYTKSEVDTALLGKAAVDHTHSEYVTDADISGKEDKANKVASNMASIDGLVNMTTKYPSVYAVKEYLNNYFYSRSEIDRTTYTKEEVDTALASKANTEDVFDILDSALEGNPSVAPTLLIDNAIDQQFNPDGHWILYYIDSDDLRHNIFDFANLPSGTSDYTDLENKPQINSHTLSGNKSSDDLGLQKKLTAGTNITIEGDGTISASGGVTSYEDLTNKPQINGITLSGNKRNSDLGFSNFYYSESNPPTYTSSAVDYQLNDIWINTITNTAFRLDYKDRYHLLWDPLRVKVFLSDEAPPQSERKLNKSLIYNAGDIWIHRFLHNSGSTRPFYALNGLYICVGSARQSQSPSDQYNITWARLDNKIQSGVVNQNGNITFTNLDGSTFTTTGSSVIGADGFSPTATVTQTASGATVSITDSTGTTTANISNGADGQDYVLTAQDKSDIADIVLSELPTTQGVLYGSTSN